MALVAGLQSLASALTGSATRTVISSQTLKAAKTAESTSVEQVSTTPSTSPITTVSTTSTPTKTSPLSKQTPTPTPTPSIQSPVEVSTPANSPGPFDVPFLDTPVPIPVVTLQPTQAPAPSLVPSASPDSPPRSNTKANSSPKTSAAPVSISPLAPEIQASDPPQSQLPTLSAPDPRSSFVTVTTPVQTDSNPFIFPTGDIIASSTRTGATPTAPTPTSTASKASTAGIIAPIQSKDGAETKGKSKGSVVGGVLGALIVLVLLGVVGFFAWKKLKRKQALNEARRSFGPFGNGIDASTGSALVSSLPPKSEPPMTEYDRNDYNRYGAANNINPKISPNLTSTSTTNTEVLAVPVPGFKRKPISTIEERSERGSMQSVGAFEKKGPLRVLNANPFEDSVIAEKKEPTLPNVSVVDPLTLGDISPVSSPTTGGAISPVSPLRANVSQLADGGMSVSGSGAGASMGSGLGAATPGSGHGMTGAVSGAAVVPAAVGAGITAARSTSKTPPRQERSPGLHNNNGLRSPAGSLPYNLRPVGMPTQSYAGPPPRGLPPRGNMRGPVDQNRPRAPSGSQGTYRYPSARERYPPGRIGDGPPTGPYPMRRRRSNSLDQGYPRNPVFDAPSGQRWVGPPLTSRGRQHNSPYYGEGASMSETGLHRRPSAASVRERPSPEHWGPLDNNSYGMGQQQPPLMMRPGAAQSQPDLHAYQYSVTDDGRHHNGQHGTGSGSSGHGMVAAQRSGSRGAAARNF